MLAIGAKGEEFMKKNKIRYTDEPIGKLKIVTDFLPSPSDLVLKENTVKVTLLLTKDSVEFFKKEAEEHHTQYQKMIRILIDQYAQNFTQHVRKRRLA